MAVIKNVPDYLDFSPAGNRGNSFPFIASPYRIPGAVKIPAAPPPPPPPQPTVTPALTSLVAFPPRVTWSIQVTSTTTVVSQTATVVIVPAPEPPEPPSEPIGCYLVKEPDLTDTILLEQKSKLNLDKYFATNCDTVYVPAPPPFPVTFVEVPYEPAWWNVFVPPPVEEVPLPKPVLLPEPCVIQTQESNFVVTTPIVGTINQDEIQLLCGEEFVYSEPEPMFISLEENTSLALFGAEDLNSLLLP
jgi:hypothetical protein